MGPKGSQTTAGRAHDRPTGETTGTVQRPAQRLSGAALRFDLAAEIERLHGEKSWREGDRDANTLVKEPGLRIILTALKAGGRVREHRAEAPVTIQAVAGHIRVHLPDGPVDLPAGQLLALEPGVPHEVEGVAESAFLVTLAGGAAS